MIEHQLAETDRPFAQALAELKEERGLSFRGLHQATRDADPLRVGLSAGHLNRLCSGTDRPSPAAIAMIAAALEIAPRYFAEYRLAEARALFDERGSGGLASALGHLRLVADRLPTASRVEGERRRTRSGAA